MLNPDHHSAFLTDTQATNLCGDPHPLPILDLLLQPGEVALIQTFVFNPILDFWRNLAGDRSSPTAS